jgi:hypothetical protein
MRGIIAIADSSRLIDHDGAFGHHPAFLAGVGDIAQR